MQHEGEHDDHAEGLGAELAEASPRRAGRPGSPIALYSASRGEVNRPQDERAPDAREAVRRERADRVVELLVDRVDAERRR